MRGTILIAGTGSDVGKSIVTAGVCRWLSRRGVRVAPFKAQNMALNSVVTAGGAEIGRAQAMQAAAARIDPEAAMNPVLIKPSGDHLSQVVVAGEARTVVDARGYQQLKPSLREPTLAALESLRERFDVVVCEGAGSPAEINLRDADIANMGLARAAGIPVLLVGDIDRGGVFASLYGTLALLEPGDQRLIAAFLINKFRGDEAILAPGLEALGAETGRPTLGVLPWRSGLWLDVEDSLALEAPREPAPPPLGADPLEVVVVRLRWMSNFTDFDALASEPGVVVRFTRSVADVRRADLVVLPGTKATVRDLERLRASGLDVALEERVRGGAPVLGLCGGYQMLGREIDDRVESGAGKVAGLGLLPVETRFEEAKLLARRTGTAVGLGPSEVSGFEIRHGRVERHGGEPLIRMPEDAEEGCRVGPVLATSWHGVLECDRFRRDLLAWVASTQGRSWQPGAAPFAAVRERRLDVLGDLVEEHVDTAALAELVSEGPDPQLPLIERGLSPCWS